MSSHLILLSKMMVFIFASLLAACSPEEPLSAGDGFKLSDVVPRINIQTELDEQLLSHDRVKSKDIYVHAIMSIDGRGGYEDLDLTRIKIRSRGHSTFAQPKKSYKIKLPAKQSLFNLPEGKNWMLLANFQDGPLMSNILAMKAGYILNLPFTAVLIPVEVTINNQYLGVYWLTPHKEVAPGRIDLDRQGLLLELTHTKNYSSDPYNKNHYLFTTEGFKLPVLVHYPRLHKIAEKNLNTANEKLKQINDELHALERELLAPDFFENFGKRLDKRSLAQFIIVYQLTYNQSLSQLESIYLHRKSGGKLTFGPIWDFDSAYGGSATREYFSQDIHADLLNDEQVGTKFFQHFLKDPELYKVFKNEWEQFKQSGINELKIFMGEYVNLLDGSGAYERDYSRWHKQQNAIKKTPRKDLKAYEKDMNQWLDMRVSHIDAFISEWEMSL
ncbi:MAG: CotH kinase family protein [Thiopseudomonas sp.]|nr:CotH kinase family protein [Thiopseudomonas sp.]